MRGVRSAGVSNVGGIRRSRNNAFKPRMDADIQSGIGCFRSHSSAPDPQAGGLGCFPALPEHEHWNLHGADHGGGRAADDELADARVTVSPHHEEIDAEIFHGVGDHGLRVAGDF